MADQPKGKPTTPVPILVGSGSRTDETVELYLRVADIFLRDERFSKLMGPVEGEISSWIEEGFGKPMTTAPLNSPRNKGSVAREVMKEAAALMADPRKKEETKLASMIGNIPSETMQSLLAVFENRDTKKMEGIFLELLKTFYPGPSQQITKEQIAALGALAVRSRAARAGAVCMARYRRHPLCLIAEARRGDKEAVLKLIKIDKQFLTDSCTAQVLRQAQLQNDDLMLRKIARVASGKPKMSGREAGRLYMFFLFSHNLNLPNLPILWGRLDPKGTQFKTMGAFAKFVERSRKEFDQIQAEIPAINPKVKL